jgi:L-threonylcarbamoyladenylate synthase
VDDLLILDGGPCQVGIESTVVDVTGERPVVLRPGVLALNDVSPPGVSDSEVVRSPGQLLRHYAPKKPMILVEAGFSPLPTDAILSLPADPAGAATILYAELRRWDADERYTRIVAHAPPDSPEWDAIRDRLKRASMR